MADNDKIGTDQDQVSVDTPTGPLAEKTTEPDKLEAGSAEPVEAAESEPEGQPDASEMKKLIEAEKAAQSMIGKQSTEIGTLKAQKAEVQRLLDQVLAPAAPVADTDYEAEMANIIQGVEEGTETGVSAAAKIEKLTTERNAAQMEAIVDAKLQDANRLQSEQAFLDRNPEFMGLMEDGTLETIRQTDPNAMGDIGMAFGIWKHQQVLAENEALKAQIPEVAAAGVEEGKASVSKLAKGSSNAASVLSDEGESVRTVNPNRPKTPQELQDSGLEALRAVREGNI
jgi:hypothetical protein